MSANNEASPLDASVLQRRGTRGGAPGQPPPPPPPLFQASHFRYSCTGALRASSSKPGSIGVCSGYRSTIEHIEDWRREMTRKDAIRAFRQKMGKDEIYGNGEPSHSTDMAYVQAPSMIVYEPERIISKSSSDAGALKERKLSRTASKAVPLDEVVVDFDDISNIGEQDWKSYGQSYVDLLVLRPLDSKQAEEKTVAIAPYCSPGYSKVCVTFRGSSEREVFRTVSIGLMGIDIVLSNSEYVQGNKPGAGNKKAPRSTAQDDTPNVGVTAPVAEVATAKDIILGMAAAKKDPNNLKAPKDESSSPSKADKEAWSTRIYTAGGKILTHMERNTKILADSVKEDFPQRTFTASKRIVQEMGKAPDRMSNLFGKINRWLDEDDRDDKKGGGKR